MNCFNFRSSLKPIMQYGRLLLLLPLLLIVGLKSAQAHRGTLTLVQPGNGQLFTKLPVMVVIKAEGFEGKLDPNTVRVTLNGQDVTRKFRCEQRDLFSAVFQENIIQYGANQLAVQTKERTEAIKFDFDPDGNRPSLPGVPQDSPEHHYVPLTTRVVRNSGTQPSDFGVSIGDSVVGISANWAPSFTSSSDNAGFQVLTIGRDKTSDQPAYSNVAYPTDTSTNTTNFINGVMNQINSHCGSGPGCVIVLQSLNEIGYTGCNSVMGNSFNASLCGTMLGLLDNLGIKREVAYANGGSTEIAFSYVGNCMNLPCGPKGAYHQRITCSSSVNSECLQSLTPATLGYGLSSTAPPNSPLNQIGNISGALVRDNNTPGYYTFIDTAPHVSFEVTSPTATSNSITFTTGGDPTLNGNQTTWWTNYTPPVNVQWVSESKPLNQGSSGGFHLLIIDASPFVNTPNVILDKTYTFLYNATQFAGSNLSDLPGDITASCPSRRCLFFFSTIGYITPNLRSEPYGNTPYHVGDLLDSIGVALASIGGDYRTFQHLGLQPYTTPASGANTSAQNDDYVLVSQHTELPQDGGELPNPGSVVEASTFITRQIYQQVPQVNYVDNPSNLGGFLEVDNDGYFEAAKYSLYQGFNNPLASAFGLAGSEPNGVWPYSTTPGEISAYKYLSGILLSGTSDDLRSEYEEEDAKSTSFTSWKSTLSGLAYPGSGHGFTQEDFTNVQSELTGELDAETTLALYHVAQQSFFTSSAVVNSDSIQSIQNQITSDLQIDTTNHTSTPKWVTIFNDAVAIAGPLGGLAGFVPGGSIVALPETALAAMGVIIKSGADASNTPSGLPLAAQEQVEIAAGNLYSEAASNYTAYKTGLDKLVNRIATDPNRLNHFYAAELFLAAANADPTSDDNLDAAWASYTLAWKREVYTKLVASSYQILQYQYAAPGNFAADALSYYDIHKSIAQKCSLEPVLSANPAVTAFLPATIINGANSPTFGRSYLYPRDTYWDFWGLVLPDNFHIDCPQNEDYATRQTNFAAYKMFLPVKLHDSGTLQENQALGIYRTYFLNPNRTGMQLITGNTADPYWSCFTCDSNPVPAPPFHYQKHPDNFW